MVEFVDALDRADTRAKASEAILKKFVDVLGVGVGVDVMDALSSLMMLLRMYRAWRKRIRKLLDSG